MPSPRFSLFFVGVVLLVGASAISAGAQTPDALLGRWEVTRVVGQDGDPASGPDDPTHFTFTEKGVLRVEQVGGTTRQGRITYHVKGDLIILEFEGRSDTEYAGFELLNDRLVLSDRRQETVAVLQRDPK